MEENFYERTLRLKDERIDKLEQTVKLLNHTIDSLNIQLKWYKDYTDISAKTIEALKLLTKDSF